MKPLYIQEQPGYKSNASLFLVAHHCTLIQQERNFKWNHKRICHAYIASEVSKVIQNSTNMSLYNGESSQYSNCRWVLNSFCTGDKAIFKGWFQPATIEIVGTGIHRGYSGLVFSKDTPLKHIYFADIFTGVHKLNGFQIYFFILYALLVKIWDTENQNFSN